MTAPRLLIFDLDGTLIDSRRDLIDCVNATLRHSHLSSLHDDHVAAFIGNGAATLVERSLQAASGDASFCHDEALAFFLAYYREHLLDSTYVYPGVLHVLASLRSLPVPPRMAVLTNKPMNPSRQICRALGLEPYLFANYGGNSFQTKKPDPEGLTAIWREAEQLEGRTLSPEQIVMIGDSEVDVRTAHNAGVQACGCTWGFAADRMLAEAPAVVAHSPADWLSLFVDPQQNRAVRA